MKWTSLRRQERNSAHSLCLAEADLSTELAVLAGEPGEFGWVVRTQRQPLLPEGELVPPSVLGRFEVVP